MILFDLNNTEQLPDISGMSDALEFLRDCHADVPEGTIELDGKNVFAIVQSYETKQEKDAPNFEAHRKYIDIQFLLEGNEIMGWAPLDAVTVNEPYDNEKDILFGTVSCTETSFTLFGPGQAIMLFPSDAHAPALAEGKPGTVKKVVVKILK